MSLKKLLKAAGEPKAKAPYRHWVPYAWSVRDLVDRGYAVADALRAVNKVYSLGLCGAGFQSMRSAYYRIKNLPTAQRPKTRE